MITQLYNGKTFNEYRGLSEDAKPETGVPNGSIYKEIDTGMIFMYDSASNDWILQPSSRIYKTSVLSKDSGNLEVPTAKAVYDLVRLTTDSEEAIVAIDHIIVNKESDVTDDTKILYQPATFEYEIVEASDIASLKEGLISHLSEVKSALQESNTAGAIQALDDTITYLNN